jgi:hypothetical protein
MIAVNETTPCNVDMPMDICHNTGKCASGECVAMEKSCNPGQMCCLPEGECCTVCMPGCTP